MYKGEVKSKGSAPVVPRQRKECEIKSLRDGERYQKDKRGRRKIIFKRKHYSFSFFLRISKLHKICCRSYVVYTVKLQNKLKYTNVLFFKDCMKIPGSLAQAEVLWQSLKLMHCVRLVQSVYGVHGQS